MRILLAGCALSLLCGCVLAPVGDIRHQVGRVKGSSGVLCLSVADNRETRRVPPLVSLVELYKRVDGRVEQIWEKAFSAEGRAKRLPADECIDYPNPDGERGPALVLGQAYSATLWTVLSLDGNTHSRWYHVYFCMIDTDNGLSPHQVLGDDWSACGAGVHW